MRREFYNKDCMVDLVDYPDDCFDLAIVDPPYGIKQGGSKNNTRGKLALSKNYRAFNDDKSPDIEYFKHLKRVSKNQIVWGANHFISKLPIDSSCWIVWDKNNGKTDFADCELAYTSFKSAVRKFLYTWNGMIQHNIKNKEIRIHPTQKPVALYKWLITNYAKEGDLILDTHVGSASSLIAYTQLGFDYVGYEIDTEYYNAAKKRLEQETMQRDLFIN